jgi:hypothetical protein
MKSCLYGMCASTRIVHQYMKYNTLLRQKSTKEVAFNGVAAQWRALSFPADIHCRGWYT